MPPPKPRPRKTGAVLRLATVSEAATPAAKPISATFMPFAMASVRASAICATTSLGVKDEFEDVEFKGVSIVT